MSKNTLLSELINYISADSSGNIGINTATPSAKLEVNGYGTANSIMTYVTAKFYGSGTGGLNIGTDGTNPMIGPDVSGTDIVFLKRVSGVYSDAMRITSGGNVLLNSGVTVYNTSGDFFLRAGTSGGLILGAGGTNGYMRITSGGNVLIGATSYAGANPVLEVSTQSAREGISIKCVSGGYSPLFIRGASNQNFFAVNEIGTVLVGVLGTGVVYSNGGNLTSTNPSDSRLKKDIKTITYGLNDILKLRPVSYNWKDDNINQGLQFGFIAQEVQEVMPDAIKEFGEEAKFLGLEKDAIYATLVNAIQELKSEIDLLKQQ